MLIDSHAHITNNPDVTLHMLKRANENDVKKVIAIGTNLKENQNVIRQAVMFDDLYSVIGIYPNEHQNENTDNNLNELKDQIRQSKKIVAIGEIGIDITNWENQRPLNDQLYLFEKQIEIAIENSLPIVIHNRNGDSELIKVLESYKGQITGVAHCFSQNWELAKNLLDLGFYISFSGFITHNSKKHLHETVKKVPIDRFLIETDSPYIVPKGIKEKQNEPKNVKIIAQKIAEIKELPFDVIKQHSYTNTCILFGI